MGYIKLSFLKGNFFFFFKECVIIRHLCLIRIWGRFMASAISSSRHCVFDIFSMRHVLCRTFPSNANYHRDRRSRLAVCRAQTGTRTLGSLDKRSWRSTFMRGCLERKDIINCREREAHRLAFVSKSLREATKR